MTAITDIGKEKYVPQGERISQAMKGAPTLSGDLKLFPNKNSAKSICDRLILLINTFEKSLTDDYQAGVQIGSLCNEIFTIDNIGCSGDDLIIFYLQDKSHSVLWLAQHITQVNLLLVAVPRTDDTSKSRRKIGYIAPEQEPPQD